MYYKMNNIFLNKEVEFAINYLKEESQEMYVSYDLYNIYIIKILIIEITIEITIKCTINWPLSILIKRLELVFKTSMNTMKFMIPTVNNIWTLLEQSKMLKEYHNILEKSKYTIYVLNN